MLFEDKIRDAVAGLPILQELVVREDKLQRELDGLKASLRNSELGLLNVKQLGYYLGRTLSAERLTKVVDQAPEVFLPSKLCTQADIESDWFLFWCREMRLAPTYHRKIWEFCYVAQVLWSHGQLREGKSGISFGCGQEPLPSLFAKYFCSVLATDLPPEREEARVWADTNQHAAGAEALRDRNVCPDEARLNNIAFMPVDMNAIPSTLDHRFDFCWSSCALEHLGSIDQGLAFIENSLRTLKPGGIAVHTTEFNLDDGETIDQGSTVLYQRKHIVDCFNTLSAKGFKVSLLDFTPGGDILDGFVDLPPFDHDVRGLTSIHSAHVKLAIGGHPCTSIGLIVTVPG